MTFFTINNQAIHVKEEGNPKKQLALLIHGWSSSSYAMSPLLPMLSRRYHCLAVDLPGYGDSAPSAQPESVEHYAELMAELIRQTNPSQGAVVVGHSMGGMIALTLATKYPDLVERLILLCPTVSGRLSLFMDLFISPAVMVERFVLPQISRLLQPYTNRVTDRLMRPASLSLRGGIT
ncbi:MAG TPA: alpha/beta hydrolase, partial [Anaerolineae bacterium]|nr:alpha/beta hydrolase [Anaerolineae bacterium]